MSANRCAVGETDECAIFISRSYVDKKRQWGTAPRLRMPESAGVGREGMMARAPDPAVRPNARTCRPGSRLKVSLECDGRYKRFWKKSSDASE